MCYILRKNIYLLMLLHTFYIDARFLPSVAIYHFFCLFFSVFLYMQHKTQYWDFLYVYNFYLLATYNLHHHFWLFEIDIFLSNFIKIAKFCGVLTYVSIKTFICKKTKKCAFVYSLSCSFEAKTVNNFFW